MNNIAIIVTCIAIVALNPIGDAIRDNGNKRLQKSIEILRDLAFLTLLYLISKDSTLVICLGLAVFNLRISFHNVLYNVLRKPRLPWYYVGTTSKSDDIESKINIRMALFNRVFTFIFACVFIYLALYR